MAEVIPWRCRMLKLLRLHGRCWLRDARTPNHYAACKGCGRMFRVAASAPTERAS